MKTILLGCILISGISFSQVDSMDPSNSIVLKVNKKNTAAKIINNYLNVIGGKLKLNKINDREIFLTGKIQDVRVKMVIYQKVPNKYYQKITLGATEQKTIFNGKKGYKIINDSVIEITGSNLKKLRYDAAVRLMGLLDAYDVEAVYVGKDTINGHPANQIKLIFPSGMKWKQFYSDSTGLKIKELKPVYAVIDTLIQKTFFENYKEVDGIKYPFKVRQSLGSFYYEFKVDSIKTNTGLSNRNFELEE